MKRLTKNSLALFSLILCFASLQGQDDLLDFLDEQEEPVTTPVIATFKSTRVVSGHSVETNAVGVMQFLIGHRFDRLNTGALNLFGIDNATIRLGFDYGITDNLNIGVGRSSFQKVYDGTVKWRFLRQKTGAKPFPFTATALSSIFINTLPWAEPDRENQFSHRLYYHHSVMFAKKFKEAFSLQIAPTLVHRNLVATTQDNNTLLGIGSGTSIKLSPSLRLNAEYNFLLPGQIESEIGGEKVRNSFSIGIDLETGGHVFQLHLTNSRGMTERFLFGETTGNWFAGDIHFGFNVSRVFTLQKPKEFRK